MYPPPGEACPACGGGLHPLGEDVAEQLEWIPGSFRVIRHTRPKLACKCCDTIVQAPARSRPIASGIAGPGLLGHVLVAKFADHLPLYRQSVIYAREGVELERALLANWVGAASALLRPLVDAIRRHVLAGTKLHADDTPIPVLAPGNGKTKTARLWTYVRDDSACSDTTPAAVWFAYTPDRKGIHPQTHLANFKGVLQADAYAGFNALYVDGTIQEAAYWAHARRKFHDLHAARPLAITTEALRRIAELYVIEAEIRGKPPHERQQVRQQRSRPLLHDFGSWLRATLEKLSRKSDTAAAIQYALNLWPALLRYCDNGIIEIDNSAAERALRGVAIGRRNYLFAGAHSGGERAAAIYSRSARPSWAVLTPRPGRAMCWPTSTIVRSIGSTTSCLELRRAVPFGLNNTPLPSGVMPSSSNSLPGSRRRWLDAYDGSGCPFHDDEGLRYRRL